MWSLSALHWRIPRDKVVCAWRWFATVGHTLRGGEAMKGPGSKPTARRRASASPPIRIRSVLVPLDGSPFAEQALPWAAAIAVAALARLRLTLVHQSPSPPPLDEGTRRLY